MQRSEFHYDLPPELIAQAPLAERQREPVARARRRERRASADRAFTDLPQLLRAGDLLVFNDTRVLPARVVGRKPTGGRVEILLERLLGRAPRARALAREPQAAARAARSSCRAARARASCARAGELVEIELDRDLVPFLEAHGADAAAALHRALAGRRRSRALPNGVRARAGRRGRADGGPALRRCDARRARGARRRARVFDVARRRRYVRARAHASASRITSCMPSGWKFPRRRARPSSAADAAAAASSRSARRACARSRRPHAAARSRRSPATAGSSSIPGFEFRVVDAMVTNFHLPESSLLMLVCAFAGQRGDARGVSARGRASVTASSATATRCS